MSTFLNKTRRSAREVADELNDLGLAPQTVVSALDKAYESGIVSPVVNVPEEEQQVYRLRNAVRRKFHLDEVLLVSGFPEILDAVGREERRGIQLQVTLKMVRKVAEYLDSLVLAASRRLRAASDPEREVSPFRIGVAWGRTMYRLTEELRCTPRPLKLEPLEMLPIIGITSTENKEPVEANVIAMRIAEAYGGKSSQLPCPAFLSCSEVGFALRCWQIQEILERIRNCDVVVTGMGPIVEDAGDGSADITISNDPTMNRHLVASAREAGAIGEVCYWLFNRTGGSVRGSYRAIGLGLRGLYDIAHAPGRKVILVTGGDRRRFEPLRVLVNGGYANVLVTDTCTARYLVGEIKLPAQN